jgi:hypothetical protein
VYPSDRKKQFSLALIWTPLLIIIGLTIAVLLFVVYQNDVLAAPLKDFDKMVVTDGFQKIDLQGGQHFDLSYEAHHDREFTGLVRHTSMDHETNFPIISFDILVTTGDFSDPSRVATSVSDHHFTWNSRTQNSPQGTINLLHTVPMNQETEDKLMKIREGDIITVEGWDILKIDGYDNKGNYIGYWEDSGCNTTLVTGVTIQ